MRKDDGNDQDTMTLRDRFAMAALTGIIACDYDRPLEFDAEAAYEAADAMLDARAKAMPVRTAEEERADVVAYLRERADQGPAFATVMLNMAAKELEDGNHVGAAERAKAGAK